MSGCPDSFPNSLWQDILLADQSNSDQCKYLAKESIHWADGRHPDDLGKLLDALRGSQRYAISLEILEAAWNSSAPVNFRAQIAQDWVGTVLYGLNDPDGAMEVAKHISKTSGEMGTSFSSDFADLLMEWGLLEAAFEILSELVNKTPGDLSAHYNLGTCLKFRGAWQEAINSFTLVSTHETTQPVVLHNLLLASIGAANSQLYQDTLSKMEQVLGPIDWQVGKIIQVELKPPTTDDPPEVLYAQRVAPHQVRLRGIPQAESLPGYDTKLLVDLAAQRYQSSEGHAREIFPVLAVLEPSPFMTKIIRTPDHLTQQSLLNRLETEQVPARPNGDLGVIAAVSASNETRVAALLKTLNL